MSKSRRNRYDLHQMTKEEKAIVNCMELVESLGAHELLTDAVVKLMEAREKLADWVDLNTAHIGRYDE